MTDLEAWTTVAVSGYMEEIFVTWFMFVITIFYWLCGIGFSLSTPCVKKTFHRRLVITLTPMNGF